MQTPQARFILSASAPAHFPSTKTPEYAFLGRSNVGKSSLLNALAATKKLAHVSAQPGRTQSINFFEIGSDVVFADLPGYGFAKVPLQVKDDWQALIEQYLLHRQQLVLCFLLLDSRRCWMDSDRELRQWLEHHGLAYQVIATKVDKLSKTELQKSLATIAGESGGQQPIAFSAVTGQGAREIWQTIKKWQRPG